MRRRRPTIPFWVRLGVPISFIIALSVGLVSFLNYYNYEKTYRQLNSSRLVVIGRDLKQTIEAGLNVGLTPKANTKLDDALFQTVSHTEGLQFAIVIDATGAKLAEAGSSSPEQDWVQRIVGIGDENFWSGADDRTYQVGLPYRNSFGVKVGAVVVGYDKLAIDQTMAAMRTALLTDWLQASAGLGLLTLLGVWWLTRRFEAQLNQVEQALDGTLSDGAVPKLDLPVLGSEIERGIPEFIRQSRRVAEALAAQGAEGRR